MIAPDGKSKLIIKIESRLTSSGMDPKIAQEIARRWAYA